MRMNRTFPVKTACPGLETLTVATNMSDSASVAFLFQQINIEFDYAEILINNTGVNPGGGGIHEESPLSTVYSRLSHKQQKVNTLRSCLLLESFINSLPDPTSTPATVVPITAGAAWGTFPTISSQANSKLAALQFNTHVAAADQNITAISLHPGLKGTDMLMDVFGHFSLDPPVQNRK
ncbi:uncharacterized protein F5Z01DRAFT_751859 [Emericellopsis atlantica]|uniref:Uncharacterized protein n=1 Tax=Emericellopsis atlantica TaxID=2614577 RepID=A0A9P7ZIF9_9HYPO|nr:uncharacterized protein F5Z01DRAFT_751859 [Emericellopsis atlantica]KAG9252728.1 hypothetical protein F5Z01DRAFT_751859 [Emericellopsis atlantica]